MNNITIGFVLFSVIGSFCVLTSCDSEFSKGKHDFSFLEDEHSIALLDQDKVVWKLNYRRDEDKPYFYPLRTLSGIDLALQRPEDHPWHRGLWFSWKYINGINYWEEERGKGVSEGRSLITDVEIERQNDYSVDIRLAINYGPDTDSVVMREERTLHISSPDASGNYSIDWLHKFRAVADSVILDRTLPEEYGGETWGGYAGLGYRANDSVLSSIRLRSSDGWSNEQSLTGYGEQANWMDLSGTIVGPESQKAGLAIFDHPNNPRHPSPWYVWFNKGEEVSDQNYQHAFFQPAIIFHKPYKLRSGESFTLKYRVLVHNGEPSVADLNDVYQKFIGL